MTSIDKLKCPKCGGTNVLRERRHNGNDHCQDCLYVWPSGKPQAKLMSPIDKLNQYLDGKERLEREATAGPWEYRTGEYVHFLGQNFFYVIGTKKDEDGDSEVVVPQRTKLENAEFIVHARNNASKEVQAMRVLVEALKPIAAQTLVKLHNKLANEAIQTAARILLDDSKP